MAYGVLDTKHINLPANIDATYLRNLTTRAGVCCLGRNRSPVR